MASQQRALYGNFLCPVVVLVMAMHYTRVRLVGKIFRSLYTGVDVCCPKVFGDTGK